MIVILNRDVKGTGKAGDVVKVSDGYARNMLLPRGYRPRRPTAISEAWKSKKQSRQRKRLRKKPPHRLSQRSSAV